MLENQKRGGLANHDFAAPLRDRNVLSRLTLAALLVVALGGATRWAFDVTDANARRVSHNLALVQNHMDANASAATETPRSNRQTIKRRIVHDGNAPR